VAGHSRAWALPGLPLAMPLIKRDAEE